MIDRYLEGEDWDDPPTSMAFELSYGELLDRAAWLASYLRDHPASTPEAREAAVALYVSVPAIVNVLLNYKICEEHGLPLHPTVYYELAEAKRYKMDHPVDEMDTANRLYRESIEIARAAYRLDADWAERTRAFKGKLPVELHDFVYTGGRDNYTWRASEPAKLRQLAEKVREGFDPELLVAAAHGSIMPALLLAEYLDRPLYFIRLSMFKRKDEAPIVSLGDEVWLSSWRDSRVLLYDEDVARGRTLDLFSARMRSFFSESKTACTIRHAGSGFKPDFFAKVWWD
jgi:hypothetical protein